MYDVIQEAFFQRRASKNAAWGRGAVDAATAKLDRKRPAFSVSRRDLPLMSLLPSQGHISIHIDLLAAVRRSRESGGCETAVSVERIQDGHVDR